MPLPGFHELISISASELRSRIADRVRAERRKIRMTQQAFAERCGVPLRTYKRFELGECDSLEVFLRIVVIFERTVGLELLFPPKQAVVTEVRSPTAALARLKKRMAAKE